MQSKRCLAFVMAGLVLMGCAGTPAPPPDWLPDPEHVASDPRGSWVTVKGGIDKPVERMSGELLAIDGENVWVAVGNTVRRDSLTNMSELRLITYDPHAAGIVSLTLLGTVATISNGFFLTFTAPAWLIGGSVATASRGRDPLVTGTMVDWQRFVPYARFPQGLPPGFDTGVQLAQVPDGKKVPPPKGRFEDPEPPLPPVEVRPVRYWLHGALGPGFNPGMSGVAFVGSGGLRWKHLMVGSRFAMVPREEDAYDTIAGIENFYDVGLLVGLVDQSGSVQVAVGAGPAAFAVRFGDLEELEASLAFQFHICKYWEQGLGVGFLVAYNANDYADFYMFSLAIGYGRP